MYGSQKDDLTLRCGLVEKYKKSFRKQNINFIIGKARFRTALDLRSK